MVKIYGASDANLIRMNRFMGCERNVGMSPFTPGPWKTTWPKFNCTIESRGGVIATVYFGQTISDAEATSNALLISLAPEMFELLKTMLANSADPNAVTGEFDTAMGQARRIVRKVEG